MMSRRIREVLLLNQSNEIIESLGKVDKKVATVQASLDDLFRDLVKENESLRIGLAQANVDKEMLMLEVAEKQEKIEELHGVIGGALDLARRCSIK